MSNAGEQHARSSDSDGPAAATKVDLLPPSATGNDQLLLASAGWLAWVRDCWRSSRGVGGSGRCGGEVEVKNKRRCVRFIGDIY